MEDPSQGVDAKWDINNFSLDDLLNALNLPPDPTPIQVTDAANSVIARMRAQGRIEEARFFEEAKEKILAAFEEEEEESPGQEDNRQHDPNTTLGNWWGNEFPSQGNQAQADKATSRYQKVQFFPNSHQQMNRERLGVNQTFNVPVMQGTINPNQRNVTNRMVFIDSSQKQNLTLAGELNTDFTLDLSEPLTNVLQMRLHSIHIPQSWYAFDTRLGNSSFGIAFSDPSTNPVDVSSACVEIPPGNYGLYDLAAMIQHRIEAEIPSTSPSIQLYFSVVPDLVTNKLIFVNDASSNRDITLTFYSPTARPDLCLADGCESASYRNQNLGWTLGFRDLVTVAKKPAVTPPWRKTTTLSNPPDSATFTVTIPKDSSVSPPAPVDLHGPKSFFLVVDDYNQNRLNKGVVSMTDRPTKLAVPSYVEPGLVDPYTGDLSCATVVPPLGMTGPARSGRVVKTYPRRLTQAQIYTANEILANRNKPDLRVPPVSADNVLAVIPLAGANRASASTYTSTAPPALPLEHIPPPVPAFPPLPGPAHPPAPPPQTTYPPLTPFIASGADLIANERAYFGPVDIERMRVKLIDDRGNLVNLNCMDWSFTLQVEELYQY